MKWKFKWNDDGEEWWQARARGCRYAIREELKGFAVYLDREDGWHHIASWPSLAEAEAAIAQNRAFPKVT